MRISVIIPTINEAQSIGSLVQFILKHGCPNVIEVIVVDAKSDDNTRSVAIAAGAKVMTADRKSRASQMNLGASKATGDVLYFIHADVQLLASFIEDILSSINNGFNAGCYRYGFDSSNLLLRLNAFFNRFGGLMCRGGDQTLFITRDLFNHLRGFDEYYTIMEDYDLVKRIQRVGRFRIIPKSIVVSARKYETNSWLRVQVANATAFLMFYCKRDPSKIKETYQRMLKYR